MPDLKLDPVTGDLGLVNGDLALTNDESGETVLQRVRIRLRMFQGEWFLDNRLGQPYLAEVFIKNPNLARIGAIFRAAIIQTPGVARIKRYSQSLDRVARKLTVTVDIATDDGTTATLNEVIG